ncbi:MAG: alpha/beta fold hydrolase [Azospirillum sp.]|nr:alpha/beta fold hydrolase [Azospirillum sp.]
MGATDDGAQDQTGNRPPDPAPDRLVRDTASIAFRQTQGASPGVTFFGGFQSDMTGTKAVALEAWAKTQGRGFLRFDYQGHGASSGRFVDGTIGLWLDDALAVLDRVAIGPQILVGSSMGAWIMVLAALARPHRVAGLVGVAAAPDFTEDLIWPSLSAAERDTLAKDGVLHRSSAYSEDPFAISAALIEDGRRHLLLRAPIAIRCPVRLIHGLADADVPWQTSLRLAECVMAHDVRMILVKDGEHRLSRSPDLALILETVENLVAETLQPR